MPDSESTPRPPPNELGQPPTPGPSSPGPHPAPPSIPDHELVRCIGRGAYGEVWLARNVMGPWRAVKIVYRRSFEHDRPFERELEGIQRFEPISRSHPSQLNVLHVGRNAEAACFYYVMELADDANAQLGTRSAKQAPTQHAGTASDAVGEGPAKSQAVPQAALPISGSYSPHTLRSDLLRRGPLPFEECLQIGLALATALDHLHRHGLVHRDIKPSNIIFVNGVPKLADIGLVAAAEHTLSAVGTEGYLPPEGPGTPQADLFSLGKVLYEMATGRDRRDYPELPTNLIDLPERAQLAELNEIVVRACESDPKARYQTAAELQADLALLRRGESVSGRRIAEHRWRIVARAAVLGMALGLLAGGGWLYQQHRAHQAHQLTLTGAEATEGGREPADALRKILFHVLDASTLQPLRNAKLRLQISKDDSRVVAREFRTDARGLCQVDAAGSWTPQFAYEVEASCHGFVTKALRWSTEQGDDLDELPAEWEVRLPKAIQVGGFVRNEEGEGIEGVVVSIAEPCAPSGREQETLGPPPHQERTDASGRWNCTHVSEQMEGLAFTLAHPEYCPVGFFCPAVAALLKGATNAPTVSLGSLREATAIMVMRRGVALSGTVTDPAGHPIAGARVAQWEQRGSPFGVEVTGPDAAFRFRNAAPGELTLVVDAKGYAIRKMATIVPREGLNIPVQLQPSKTLKGRVVDPSGQPVPGARVQLDWEEPYTWSSRTDSDGRFVYDSAPAETLSYKVSEAHGFNPATVSLVGDGEEKIIRLAHSAERIRILGRVTDAATRQPIAQFKVLTHERSVDGLAEMEFSPHDAVLGREGRFRVFVDWPVTSYDLEVVAEDYVPQRTGWLHRREGSRRISLNLEHGAALRGTVVLPDGQPAAGAEVGLATSDTNVVLGQGKLLYPEISLVTHADAEGRFSFSPQRRGFRVVAVHAAGYQEVSESALAAGNSIQLEPWGRIEGTVRIENSAPSNCIVRLVAPMPDPLNTRHVSLQIASGIDDQGRFTIRHVPRGEFALFPVIRNTYCRGARVTVEPGSTQRVDFVVGGGRAITGRFVWAEPAIPIHWRSPVHRFRLVGYPCQPAPAGRVETGWSDRGGLVNLEIKLETDGAFRMNAIPEGTYQLEAAISRERADGATGLDFPSFGAAAREVAVLGTEGTANSPPLDLGLIEVKRHERTTESSATRNDPNGKHDQPK